MALAIMTTGVVLYAYNDISLSPLGLAICFIDILVGIISAVAQAAAAAAH